MNEDLISDVVHDLKTGNYRLINDNSAWMKYHLSMDGKIVDATAIYHSIVDKAEEVKIYDNCIAPALDAMFLSYVNRHGNVMAMYVKSEKYDVKRGPLWDSPNAVDWAQIKWITRAILFAGGYSQTKKAYMPTIGPLRGWEFAIRPDGFPDDIHWVQFVDPSDVKLKDCEQLKFENDLLILLTAINFMNCRNVEIVEPTRPRAVRRRLERQGIQIHEINIMPIGKSVRGSQKGSASRGTPLTSVRGHFALYGSEHGRGLLFGKYAGRFWISQHARGDKKHGVSENSYKIMA